MTQKPDADLSEALLGRLGVLDVAREVHSEGPVYLHVNKMSVEVEGVHAVWFMWDRLCGTISKFWAVQWDT